jgi:hypothetical protein
VTLKNYIFQKSDILLAKVLRLIKKTVVRSGKMALFQNSRFPKFDKYPEFVGNKQSGDISKHVSFFGENLTRL